MKCVNETLEEWVFSCIGCGQVRIITRPEHRQKVRREVEQLNGIRKFF